MGRFLLLACSIMYCLAPVSHCAQYLSALVYMPCSFHYLSASWFSVISYVSYSTTILTLYFQSLEPPLLIAIYDEQQIIFMDDFDRTWMCAAPHECCTMGCARVDIAEAHRRTRVSTRNKDFLFELSSEPHPHRRPGSSDKAS